MVNKMKGKIFNAQEVQAMLNGSKVMFREVIKQPFLLKCYKNRYYEDGIPEESKICDNTLSMRNAGMKCCDCNNEIISKCPYQVGQKIFCKESFGFEANGYGEFFVYKSDNPAAIYAKTTLSKEVPVKWKPAQHMKQEHSRLTLLIKEIKVERLAEISREDCLLEGVESYYTEGAFHTGLIDEIEAFEDIWNATHKKPEEKFEANPFVWVISFEVVK